MNKLVIVNDEVCQVLMLGGSGDVAKKVGENGNHVLKETVIERVDAATSAEVPKVAEVAASLEGRDFESCSLTLGYDMEGGVPDNEELD